MNPNTFDFKNLWNQTPIEVPNIKEIQLKMSNYQRKQVTSTLCQIVGLGIIALGIAIVWYFLDYEKATTKWGLILLLLALVFFVFLNFKNFVTLKKINTATSNKNYLSEIKKLQKQRIYMQNNGIKLYYVLLTIGFSLYFYEFALKLSNIGAILAYGLTFFWMGITWFLIIPKQTKRQNQKMNEIILTVESIEKEM
ncbi:MAG: hypothetical protein KBS61_04605 [Chryseobacterium sp.]|nr:hypothetical protein [Candidatus Chryseobacterium enterohippi]